MPVGISKSVGLTSVEMSRISATTFAAFTPCTLPLASLKSMKIYFDCGDRDHYGFNVGAQQLDDVLKSRGVPHEAHIYPGGHDMQFVLEHFGASLEWHSKALK